MSRLFYHVMQDNAGNLLFDVSGTMRLAGTGTVATIYGDEALTVILPNPMTNHPSFGSFKCFLGAGDYDFYMAKSGYTFETLTGVQGHGTMAQQDANAVAITGGTVDVTSVDTNRIWTKASPEPFMAVIQDVTGGGPGSGLVSYVSAGTNRYNLHLAGTAQNYMVGPLGLGSGYLVPEPNFRLSIDVNKVATYGIKFKHTNGDTGTSPVIFTNAAGTDIGSITTTSSATAYNTSSDARLKHAIAPLTGALSVVLALRPVAFRWNADDSADIGFLAHEVMTVAPGAVQGLPDDVNPDGTIKPQQLDQSKLMPLLVAAVKELLARVEVLEQALA